VTSGAHQTSSTSSVRTFQIFRVVSPYSIAARIGSNSARGSSFERVSGQKLARSIAPRSSRSTNRASWPPAAGLSAEAVIQAGANGVYGLCASSGDHSRPQIFNFGAPVLCKSIFDAETRCYSRPQ
jgi:hypothetical protein